MQSVWSGVCSDCRDSYPLGRSLVLLALGFPFFELGLLPLVFGLRRLALGFVFRLQVLLLGLLLGFQVLALNFEIVPKGYRGGKQQAGQGQNRQRGFLSMCFHTSTS